ncbi:ribonuclease R [Candidatus Oleimmundimicrobium sp.]|uniref:ribonuclease R n=1 Tax=Candidatus Oleimmundimicrobium sp. TaxID=3060597 RepID=UPI00271665A4|nr:ribonuclease R [Candidatus Oleimmundimicrobium sp.]MDO8885696.1 ribonuclease R [Candidatus Oleimmundimicrobium sp.]
MDIKSEIINLIQSKKYRPLSLSEFAERIGESNFILIQEALNQLEGEGKIIKTKKDKYDLPERLNIVVGRLQVNRRGYGFILAKPHDVFVPKTKMNGALNKDRVMARLFGRGFKDGNIEGQIIKVIERANTKIVGKFVVKRGTGYVFPTDKKISCNIVIPPKLTFGAKNGQLVVCEIEQWPTGKRPAKARITEILGDKSTPNIEMEIVIREHDLPLSFPSAVIKETEIISDTISTDEISNRRDYRDIFTVTIDGADAKDFDDAISISKDDKGNFNLIIHIADVSHYVKFNVALDEEARERGNSVYLVDRVIPMLPQKLSNGICSLNPKVDRLSFSVEIVVDATGEVRDFNIFEGVIKSDARLTYEGVDEQVEKGEFEDKTIERLIGDLKELSDILDAKRLKRGSLNFETVEPKVLLDKNFKPIDVVMRERTVATKLIEEAMILTNEVVAGFMYHREAPMVYRVHEEPDYEVLMQLAELLKEMDYPLKGKINHPKNLQKIIAFAHDKPEKFLINSILLRAMKQAKYYPECLPHFGLASSHYTHFTSPIRRYSDLVVHRLVKRILKTKGEREQSTKLIEELYDVCEHISICEREAEDAERESVNVKLCELMSEHVGEVFKGVITGVTGFGFFVQLSNSIEGLVHIRSLNDDFYVYDSEHFLLRGERLGKIYRLGERIMVKLVNINIEERIVDFAVV